MICKCKVDKTISNPIQSPKMSLELEVLIKRVTSLAVVPLLAAGGFIVFSLVGLHALDTNRILFHLLFTWTTGSLT